MLLILFYTYPLGGQDPLDLRQYIFYRGHDIFQFIVLLPLSLYIYSQYDVDTYCKRFGLPDADYHSKGMLLIGSPPIKSNSSKRHSHKHT